MVKSNLQKFVTCVMFLILPMMSYSNVAHSQAKSEIRFVLQITVDGLRMDLLSRGSEHFGDNGFRRLLKKGAVFTNAHYNHANTETIVGHATLATGAHPSHHGMIGNVWFDRSEGELTYNIEDFDYPLLPVRTESQVSEQVDPAQKLARTQGRSPRSLLVETIGDKLLSYSGAKSKVFAVSGKDRSAVAMAGHGGKAFWFSSDSGDFITSTYYYDGYPDWVANWNAERKGEAWADKEWNLLGKAAEYSLAHQDDRPYETDLRGYGRTFPHRFGGSDNKLLYTQLVASPVGDQLLSDFAQTLMRQERMGKDTIPDYLSISFSGVDAVNHFFGPSSLETQDALRQLDSTISKLLSNVDKVVGLEHTLIILSADHGMAELPEYMEERNYPSGRLYPEDIVEAANRIGKDTFGLDNLVKFYYRPYLYLDNDAVAASGKNEEEILESIAANLMLEKGIHLAVTKKGLNTLPDSKLVNQIRNNYYEDRAGDIYIVQEPYWFNFDKGPVAGMHGSPWRYDTHVPIIFSGPRIPAVTVQRLVHPVDIASTISALLGMSPPASAQGTVLPEVF